MASRRVLLIIDVQEAFINKATKHIVKNIQSHLLRDRYECVIQACWENHLNSKFEKELNYTECNGSFHVRPLLDYIDAEVIVHHSYSAFTPELKALLMPGDDIFVVGADIDACVLATLFDLWDAGYTVHVYQDSVATSGKGLTQPVLRLIERNFGKGCLI